MQRLLVTLALGLFLATGTGCTSLSSPFTNDPLTGGLDVTSSQLLGVPIPAGLQRYNDHGFIRQAADGAYEGLETLRGNVDVNQLSQGLFANMQTQGWQMQMALRKGNRACYTFERGNTQAVLAFHRQAMLTILEIWVSNKDSGTMAPMLFTDPQSGASLSGEHFDPISGAEAHEPQPGATESWGIPDAGSGSSEDLQERSL